MTQATLAAIERRTLDAHLARQDRFASLEEVSFADLLELEDELSDGGDWSTLDDVRLELNSRRAEAMGRLSRVFSDAISARGVLPTVIGGKLANVLATVWVAEWASTNDGTDKCIAMLFDSGERPRVIGMLSAGFAKDSAEDLLRAGWTA